MKKEMKMKTKKGTVLRLLRLLFGFYPVLLPVALVLIVAQAAVGAMPSLFMNRVIDLIDGALKNGTPYEAVAPAILSVVLVLVGLYAASLLANFVQTRLMAVITQGFLYKMRKKMFDGMQNLPIRYFDTHKSGDVMSYYTNDIDTLRQMVSQSMPQLLISAVTILTVFSIMLYFCLWLALLVVAGVVLMTVLSRKVGGGSAKYFVRQQIAIGKTEGFIQEMMNGQKVVKVFCHEKESLADFDKINDALYEDSRRAHRYANILMPLLNNVGNVLYALVAIVGGVLLVTGAPNVSLSGLSISIAVVVPFLNMS